MKGKPVIDPVYMTATYKFDKSDDLIDVEYVLVPVRIVQGLKPMHDLLIFQNFDAAEIPKFEGHTLAF